jgi:hypothetical protein
VLVEPVLGRERMLGLRDFILRIETAPDAGELARLCVRPGV